MSGAESAFWFMMAVAWLELLAIVILWTRVTELKGQLPKRNSNGKFVKRDSQ